MSSRGSRSVDLRCCLYSSTHNVSAANSDAVSNVIDAISIALLRFNSGCIPSGSELGSETTFDVAPVFEMDGLFGVCKSSDALGLEARYSEEDGEIRIEYVDKGGVLRLVGSIRTRRMCTFSFNSDFAVLGYEGNVPEGSSVHLISQMKFVGHRGFQDAVAAGVENEQKSSSGKKKKKRQAKPTPKKDKFVRGKNRAQSL